MILTLNAKSQINQESLSKRSKRDQAGRTKSMTDHLNALHSLCNPKKQCVSSGTLDKFVQSRHPKKPLSIESLKTSLVYFLAKCDLPLLVVESPAFHTLLELCNSSILNILVLRVALTSHLSKIYFFHQEHLCKILSNNTSTSPNVRAFMAVTAHFLKKDFSLQSVILGLIELNGSFRSITGPTLHGDPQAI
ncbi:hypothetical protein O181_126920 [Austropuccinia psidii MF-1]|uniref:Uncharacterized protein n=1 Tax=Austropuccinia psidii MF-1 TaxID=1389203 RepID=A0A9Q3KS79_9BASI|nr:hypothetical protein [Austropuccinia psidii MF-1]